MLDVLTYEQSYILEVPHLKLPIGREPETYTYAHGIATALGLSFTAQLDRRNNTVKWVSLSGWSHRNSTCNGT
jgi:hypothetical protein